MSRLSSTFGIAGAEDVPPYVREAEVRYKQGDYEGAIGYLLAVPGVAQLSPKADADESGFTRTSCFMIWAVVISQREILCVPIGRFERLLH